jgi:hypothetical protein
MTTVTTTRSKPTPPLGEMTCPAGGMTTTCGPTLTRQRGHRPLMTPTMVEMTRRMLDDGREAARSPASYALGGPRYIATWRTSTAVGN